MKLCGSFILESWLHALAVGAMVDKKRESKVTLLNYSEYIRNQRMLDDYIRTSLWDEQMNRKREFWLWERRQCTPDPCCKGKTK